MIRSEKKLQRYAPSLNWIQCQRGELIELFLAKKKLGPFSQFFELEEEE